MNNEALQKACLSATLAVAWAGSSSPAVADTPGTTETIYIRTNFYHSLAVAKFVAIRDLTWIGFDLGAVPAGESYRSVGISLGSGSGGVSYNMLVAGEKIPPGQLPTTILGVGFHDPKQGLGVPFETIFPGVNEQEAIASLMGTSTIGDASLTRMLGRIVATPNMNLGINEPLPHTMLHFSDGELMGTIEASFTPIPEPAMGTFCVGLLGFGLLRARWVR